MCMWLVWLLQKSQFRKSSNLGKTEFPWMLSFRIFNANLEKITGRLCKIHEPSHIVFIQDALKKPLRFYPYKIKLILVMKAEERVLLTQCSKTLVRMTGAFKRFALMRRKPFKSLELSTGIMKESGEPVIQESQAKEQKAPKVDVCWGLLHSKSLDPFFVTQNSFLQMLESFVFPQL